MKRGLGEMGGQDTARGEGRVRRAEGGKEAQRRELGRRYGKALGKMKVTEGHLRPISLSLPLRLGPGSPARWTGDG